MGQVPIMDPARYGEGVPHELFAELRAQGAVHRHDHVWFGPTGEEVAFWSVVRHAEVQRANRDWETFAAVDGVLIPPYTEADRVTTIVASDPPDHTRLRRLINLGFTPRMVGQLEAHIVTRAQRILDEAATKDSCDFVRDVAYPLPMHVIADIVGIPEAERPWVFEHTDTILRCSDPTSGLNALDKRKAHQELFGYAMELSERKRKEPADDIWTLIAQAELPAEDGSVQRLERSELGMFLMILALAGSETTRNALAHAVIALLEHPDQLDEVRNDPGVLAGATEEIIRWASPVLFFARTATCDTELGGVAIPRGDRVVLWYASANRDERAFEEPFRFDIHRNPNPHVSFGGGGPHLCLGAHLARKEIQVLIPALFRQFDVVLAGRPQWNGAGAWSNVGASIDRLPVRLSARR